MPLIRRRRYCRPLPRFRWAWHEPGRTPLGHHLARYCQPSSIHHSIFLLSSQQDILSLQILAVLLYFLFICGCFTVDSRLPPCLPNPLYSRSWALSQVPMMRMLQQIQGEMQRRICWRQCGLCQHSITGMSTLTGVLPPLIEIDFVLKFPISHIWLSLTIMSDSKRTRQSQTMANTLQHSSKSVPKSSRFKTSGGTTITLRSRTLRCESPYIFSSKASSQYGKIDGMWMEEVGPLECPRLMVPNFGLKFKWWQSERHYRAA